MKKRSKRFKKLKELIKDKKVNNFETAIGEIKKMPNPKLLESIDISLKVNLKKIPLFLISLRILSNSFTFMPL